MKVLVQASKAAMQAQLAQKDNAQRYSRFPVQEAEFWGAIYKFAKNPKTAQKVLDEMANIEDEQCIVSGKS